MIASEGPSGSARASSSAPPESSASSTSSWPRRPEGRTAHFGGAPACERPSPWNTSWSVGERCRRRCRPG
eukprot:2378130-Alexandrium_andersonii.AAC.1